MSHSRSLVTDGPPRGEMYGGNGCCGVLARDLVAVGSWRLEAARRDLRLALARLTGAGLGLALAAHAGRLIPLATTRLREDAVLLHFSGESLQCDFK